MTTEMLKDEVKISTDIYNKDVDRSELYSAKFQLQQAQRAIIDAKGSIIKPLELLKNFSGLFSNICVALQIFLTLSVYQ